MHHNMNAEEYYDLGLVFYNSSDFETAIQYFTEAINHHPTLTVAYHAYNNRGLAYFGLKMFTLATIQQ